MSSISSRDGAERVLEGLSDAQRAAASYTDGPLIIVAGPGSGKTRVMSHRMAYIMASGVPPWRALGVTFTNKAAGELLSRCERLAAKFMPGAERPHVSTFHSWGARFLRNNAELVGLRTQFTIYDRDDQTQLMKRIIADTQYDHSPGAMINEISRAKNDNVDPDLYASQSTDRYREQQGEIYALYQQALTTANAVDFDDLLMLPCRALGEHADIRERLQHRYIHLMVDEFQDTNALQFELVKLLGAVHQNVCVVGDPDQSIYSWRNARPENMNNFRDAFGGAKVFELNESYRSTQNIISAADSLIAHNKRHFDRTLFTNNAAGAKIRIAAATSPEHEATLVLNRFRDLADADPSCEAAVLYRTNAQSRVVETECNLRGIPYRLIGGTRFYERREIKDALALLKIVVNPTDEVSLRRILNVPPRGIGTVTIQRLEEYALNNRMPLMEAVLDTIAPLKGGGASLRGRAQKAVAGFARFTAQLIANAAVLNPQDLLEFALRGSGYYEWLNKEPETALERRQNLDELLSVAHQYGSSGSRGDQVDASAQDHADALQQFLEHTALFTNLDREDYADASAERPISLISLHQAKGLEFDAVFIIGASESLLPHQLALEDGNRRNGDRPASIDDDADGSELGGRSAETTIEHRVNRAALMEERRLMYVGMTRAKRDLQISYSDYSAWGASQRRSRFIDEIAEKYVEVVGGRRVTSDVSRAYGSSDGRYSDAARGGAYRYAGGVVARPNSAGWSTDGRRNSRPRATSHDDGRGDGMLDSDGARSTRYKPGDRVTHPHFGDGVVINCRETASDAVLNVAFADNQAGVRQLVASMANLTRTARTTSSTGANADADDSSGGDADAAENIAFDD